MSITTSVDQSAWREEKVRQQILLLVVMATLLTALSAGPVLAGEDDPVDSKGARSLGFAFSASDSYFIGVSDHWIYIVSEGTGHLRLSPVSTS